MSYQTIAPSDRSRRRRLAATRAAADSLLIELNSVLQTIRS
jgi:hypothetical protein